MSLPRSYTRHSLEFWINGLRESLANDPDGEMAPRWRKSLERAEAELSELKSMMGEQSHAQAQQYAVDGRGRRYPGAHVARGRKRFSNRKGA